MPECALLVYQNLKEIHLKKLFFWLKFIVVNRCEEEKCEKIGNFQKHIPCKLLIRFPSNLVCKVMYIEGINM